MPVSAGTRLGPYEILEPLGAGGMGVVYRAWDPRLSREVAVKIITTDGTPSPDRLRRFENEARAAAQLSHPNVVTVHDVGTHEGHPYLVLELLEGETLREALRGSLPPLRQAVSWALEVSRGLAAAHERGIVHRDLKPENVFLTTDDQVKILDFGLAKLREPLVSDEADRESPTVTKDTSPGVLLGTVGYMSPEQVKGQTPDPRTDVFALGTVLFEMVTGRRAFGAETAPEILAAILRDEPPSLESIRSGIPAPLETVVRRCLAKRPSDRFSSGRALEAALDTVLPSLEPSRASGARPIESRGPYPGLSSFTEADAERFFGREAEVEALWTKLRRGRLLAVIGPSGAGKTSFVRAGLVPSRPSGWGAIVTTPGAAPLRGLAEALVGEMPTDPDTMRELLRFDDPDVTLRAVRRWRDRHLEAVLVVDQFEELFTLSSGEVQKRFAELLGQIAHEADVRVLLSMRDDFLIRCHEQRPLGPVFLNLTPLLSLEGEDLRRALTEPAEREDFAFEDDALVAEMLESVEGARGALPLLAFAVSRLWEKRDRETKLLTHRAYEEIGGVAGALAQHAEQTLERIGLDKVPVVRELFRNLVTAQWTRAAADREELLSALPDREAGARVLDHLIDARLLTSYEVRDTASHPEHDFEASRAGDLMSEPFTPAGTTHRIEIVHESLLRAWPRLVRWQAQDEEGAVLRDQLKQAAHLWEEKGRPDDLLWTGTSEREFELWQERYPGNLTALEDDFAQAMVRRAERRKQVRRTVTAAVVAGLSLVAAAIAVSRHQEAEARWLAEAEAQRAEAGKLLALGQTFLEDDPTAALAYARGSLELFDTPEARAFVLEALWRGPVARILPVPRSAEEQGLPADAGPFVFALSPDGRWLATLSSQQILLFSRDGGPPRAVPRSPDGNVFALAFGPRGDVLVTGGPGSSLRFWALPGLREIRSAELGGLGSWGFSKGGSLLTWTRMEGGDSFLYRSWPLPDGEPTILGTFAFPDPWDFDLGGTAFAYGRNREVHLRSLAPGRPSGERILGSAMGELLGVVIAPEGNRVASLDGAGEIRVWATDGEATAPPHVLQSPRYLDSKMVFDPAGRLLTRAAPAQAVHVWDLEGPPDSEPLILGRGDTGVGFRGAFGPGGRWLTTSFGLDTIELWPLRRPWVRVLRGFASSIWRMAFTSDGRWLATCSMVEPVRLWPLNPADGRARDLAPTEACASLATDPDGNRILLGTFDARVLLLSTAGGLARPLLDAQWEGADFTSPVAFDGHGDRAFAGPVGMGGLSDPRHRVFRVWDLETGQGEIHSLADVTDAEWYGLMDAAFAPDGSLYVAGSGPVRRVVLPDEPGGTVSSDTVFPARFTRSSLSRGGRLLLVQGSESSYQVFEELHLFDLARHTSRRITTHGASLTVAVFDPAARVIVTADAEGVVRAGPVSGEEPHLLLGSEGRVHGLAVSPDGRWIASATDESIRLWPMPDVTKPPLHTLPDEELLAKLDALTNLRVVRDPDSSTGWTLDIGPFPGWEDVPTW